MDQFREKFTPDRKNLHRHRLWCLWQIWGVASIKACTTFQSQNVGFSVLFAIKTLMIPQIRTGCRRTMIREASWQVNLYRKRMQEVSSSSGEWAVSTNRTIPLGSFEAALNLVTGIIGHFQSTVIFSHVYLHLFEWAKKTLRNSVLLWKTVKYCEILHLRTKQKGTQRA